MQTNFIEGKVYLKQPDILLFTVRENACMHENKINKANICPEGCKG